MRKALVLAFVVAAGWCLPATAYIIHDDGGNDPTIPDWLEAAIHDDHTFDVCTNHTHDGQTAKKWCSNDDTTSPRENETACGKAPSGRYLSTGCWAYATVLCPGMTHGSSGSQWWTFACVQEEADNILAPVGAGLIGYDGTKQIRGVKCGSYQACGCRVDSPTSSSPWGVATWDTSGGVAICQ